MNKIPKIALLLLAVGLYPLKSFSLGEDACECIKIKVHSTDTLRKNSYLDYSFDIRNTCKNKVWINTGHFGFAIYEQNGRPAKKLRELTFVKRYKYPEFVLIEPNAEYQFKFSDDAFYEYQLERHTRYVLGLRYTNTKVKHPSKKNLNFLCNRELKRFLYIK